MALTNRFAAASALAAAFSLAATPAAAADLPAAAPQGLGTPHAVSPYDTEAENVQKRRWHRYRGRDRVDAGDVLAGVLIIGGIAAIANAATRDSRQREDYRYRDYRHRDYDYRTPRPDSRYDARGIDNAVNMCVAEIERDVRVASVDGVDRTGAGWLVTGSVYDGEGFACRIGNDGRIENVSYGQRSVGYETPSDDRQWDEDIYLSARARMGVDAVQVPAPGPEATPYEEQLPAYPGGPLPGDIDAD